MNIGNYLIERYGKWGWVGQRAHDASGINKLLPLDFIVSCDYGKELPYYFLDEKVFSFEKRQRKRKNWSNEHLKEALRGSLGKKILNYWDSSEQKINLLCYRSVRKIERYVNKSENKLTIHAVSESLKKYFDDKILLFHMLSKLGLPNIQGKIDTLGRNTFNRICKEFSYPFVIQFPYGSSGNSTFIVREEKEYKRLRRLYPEEKVIIRKYIDGYSTNVNALIVSSGKNRGIFCSYPSVQLIGIKECSNYESAFCGNDFTATKGMGKEIIKQIGDIVEKIGKWMLLKGYKGIFGMDFVIKDGVVYPIEINPRFQNSTSLYITMNKRSKLLFAHISEFLNKDEILKKHIDDRKFSEKLMNPIDGSQIILHNHMRWNMQGGEVAPGIYRYEDGKMSFLRQGATLDDCENTEEILITCGVTEKDMLIEPNAPICKIQTLGSVVDDFNKRGEISKKMKKVVSYVYNILKLKEITKVSILRENKIAENNL